MAPPFYPCTTPQPGKHADVQDQATPPLHATPPHIAEALARQHVTAGIHEFECALGGLTGMEKKAVQQALRVVRPAHRVHRKKQEIVYGSHRKGNTAKTTDPIWDSRNSAE